MIVPLSTPRIYTSKHEPGPYRPSNGTEGRLFEEWFCSGCIHDHAAHMGDLENGCLIFARAIVFHVGEEHYPTEWVIADDGYPACTAFDPDGCS